jgi:hypothetical protein
MEVSTVGEILPAGKYLCDAVGSPITEGSCARPRSSRRPRPDRSQPALLGTRFGHWDGWVTVTATRRRKPLRGKLMGDELGPVPQQELSRAS